MNSIMFDKTGNRSTSALTELYRCTMVTEIIQEIVDKIIEFDNNFTFVSKITGTNSSGRMYGRWIIDVGAAEFYFFIEYVSKSGSTQSTSGTGQGCTINIGIVNRTDSESINYIYSTSIGTIMIYAVVTTIDSKKYYHGTISTGFWYITNNNKLNGLLELSSTQPSNSVFCIVNEDMLNNDFILFWASSSSNSLYYFNDETTTLHTVDTTTRTFSTENKVLFENIPIIKSSEVVALVSSDFVKIHSEELNTKGATTGTKVMVDSKQYRKMNYSFFLLDND